MCCTWYTSLKSPCLSTICLFTSLCRSLYLNLYTSLSLSSTLNQTTLPLQSFFVNKVCHRSRFFYHSSFSYRPTSSQVKWSASHSLSRETSQRWPSPTPLFIRLQHVFCHKTPRLMTLRSNSGVGMSFPLSLFTISKPLSWWVCWPVCILRIKTIATEVFYFNHFNLKIIRPLIG